MKLKVLGVSQDALSMPRNYRGVERYPPFYETDSNANQLFYQYLYSSDDLGFVQDLDLCQRMVEVYGSLAPPQQYEVVEVTEGDQPPVLPMTEFLGFDIACVYRISLLSWGLAFDTVDTDKWPATDLIHTMEPLFQLVMAYFRPKLNRNGLFDEHGVARFFLDTMVALQKIRPNLWESDDCEFQVLGVWQVTQGE